MLLWFRKAFIMLRINMKSALKVTLSLDACAYYIISLKMQEKGISAIFYRNKQSSAVFVWYLAGRIRPQEIGEN